MSEKKADDTQAFLDAYRRVFDDGGNIRSCGRDTVMQLITAADRLEPGVRHGDRHGFMDQASIARLAAAL